MEKERDKETEGESKRKEIYGERRERDSGKIHR